MDEGWMKGERERESMQINRGMERRMMDGTKKAQKGERERERGG